MGASAWSNDSVHPVCNHRGVDSPLFEKRTPEMSTWRGRQPRGYRCVNSFQEFVDQVKRTKEGKVHLARHHAGFTGKKKKES